MKKYFSLIKASMSEGMNVFSVSIKNNNKLLKIFLPVFLAICIMGSIYSYADQVIVKLQTFNMEFVLLSLFVILTSILTIIEGIYKSGNLLFNCKDDNLLLSLPIKKNTVLFIRMLKFYLFELAYNSLFLLPAIIAYANYMHPDITFYVISLIGLMLFPIIPIIISCFIGTFTTFVASKFKGKNIVQTVLTIVLLLFVLYVSFNLQNLINDLATNATSVNELITKIYYPAGEYIDLVTNFNIIQLFRFIAIHMGLLIISILLIGKVYFKINSRTKSIKTSNNSNKEYKIKTSHPIKALIKKEFNRFVNSTVFITNAGFGLVLFILACILLVIKFDSFAETIIQSIPTITIDLINNNISVVLFTLVSFSCFMTSITSSMISLEGKSFNILKSLPVKPYTIVSAKVLASIIIMLPCIFIGDIIVFIRFQFDIISMILIIIASVLFPLLSETIGIIVNLKYPRMDAKNDTEVVKQSISSAISVFIGMILVGVTAFLLYKAFEMNMQANMIIISITSIYAVIYIILNIYLNKTSVKSFNNIKVN